MSQWTRFVNLLRGKTEAFLDSAENPETQLSRFAGELNREVEGLHRAVAAAIADEKRLRMEIEDHLVRATEWENRAVLALKDGDEALARQALIEKEQCEARSLAMQKAWESQQAATDKLKGALQTARARVNEAKSKYTLLVAQYRSAATTRKMQQTLSSAPDSAPVQMMERLADRIRLLEAQTEADAELNGGANVDLEGRFAELERRTKADEALAQLRERIGDRRALPDHGSSVRRLEDLKAKLERS